MTFQSYYIKQRNAIQITDWFHRPDAMDISPAITVATISDVFIDFLYHYRFNLPMPENKFRITLCDYICTSYHAHKTGKQIVGPNTYPKLPSDWTYSMHQTWIDYISHEYFTDDFWNDFWENIPISQQLTESLPHWKENMQALLIYYVKGDHDVMVKEGMIFESEGGHLVAAEDYESPSEDYKD